MIISKTPLRLSMFGGSTDVKNFYNMHGSLIINGAITKYVYILVKYTPPIFNYRTSVQYSKIEHVDDNSLILHNGCRGVLQYFDIKDGLQISNLIDLPSRTGLGSSSAYVVGLLNTCHKLLKQHDITKLELANEAIFVERDLLHEDGGIQDQIASSYGGINTIEINTDGTYKVKPLPITREFIKELNRSMVLFYLGQRDSFDISKSHCTKEAEQYKLVIKQIAEESLKAFDNENIDEIGRLLDESWKQKRQTSPLISTQQIDELHDKLMYNGALGLKLSGSGGSGFLLCLTHDKQKLIEKINLNHIDFSFDFEGSKIILQ